MFKKTHRIPELWVQDADEDRPEVYSLSGERHLLGRSSKSCDIVVHNPIISPIHLSLTREGKRFILKDENSTNGVYQGKHRITTAILHHGDIFTLGQPAVPYIVIIEYSAPPLYFKFAAYIKQYLLEITEYTLLLASIVGLVTAVFFQKLIFGAAPLSLYIVLNLLNSYRANHGGDFGESIKSAIIDLPKRYAVKRLLRRYARGERIFLIDLNHADLSNVDLRGARIRGNLSGANLSGADLREANLSEANLSGADLREANLSGAFLNGANMIKANLDSAILVECVLREAVLTSATLRNANLIKASLQMANLTQAQLPWSKLSNANLAEANLSDANLNESDLSDADLTEANMIKVDLARSSLTKANLTKASLIKAKLRRANLTGANLKEAYLTNADLEWANLTEADLRKTYLMNANLKEAYLTRANLTGTSLEEVDLSQTGDLTGAIGLEDID